MTTISPGMKKILKYFYVPNNNTKNEITLASIYNKYTPTSNT